MQILHIARVCHEANRAYCQSIGDDSQVAWDEAPNWQQASAIKGVQYFRDNPSITPKEQHDAWVADKLENGWRFGVEKDPDAKTHPCLVDYDQLPAAQRGKDLIFQAVARELLPFLED